MEKELLMNFIFAISLSFAAFFVFVTPVLASGGWELRESENALDIRGECSGSMVQIALFPKKSDASVYTASASCERGAFSFSDNLLQWNLPEGKYLVVVDGERSSSKKMSIRYPEPEETAVEPAPLSVVTPEESVPDTPESEESQSEESSPKTLEEAQREFGQGVVGLQASLVEMRIGLASSAYPDVLKQGTAAILDLLESSLFTIQELFFRVESQDFDGDEASTGEDAPGPSPDASE